jgi:hypothetical protein
MFFINAIKNTCDRETHVIKKTCDFHMFKGHMSLLYVDCRKFLTNRFVGNFCSYKIDMYLLACKKYMLFK